MRKISFLLLVWIFCLGVNALSQESISIHQIVLANGERLEGYIQPLDEGKLLIQTKDLYLEVTTDQINQVDGSADLTEVFRSNQTPLLTYRTYEELSPEGNLVVYSHFNRRNSSDKLITRLDWGKAPHELSEYQEERVYDEFGNELLMQEVSRDDGGRHVFVDLAVPVLPGEKISFSHRFTTQKNVAQQKNGTWVYKHAGDYPENRLVIKMVRLPQRAEIVNISPKPVANFEFNGYVYVAWRRYYVKGEVAPLIIEYKLP